MIRIQEAIGWFYRFIIGYFVYNIMIALQKMTEIIGYLLSQSTPPIGR